jgi:hypothetical protein
MSLQDLEFERKQGMMSMYCLIFIDEDKEDTFEKIERSRKLLKKILSTSISSPITS